MSALAMPADTTAPTTILPLDSILHGDALAMLRALPSESVQCVVTSPPYWGLRDYGVPGQLGLEPTPDEYLTRMVAVFAEVRRVLRSDGTCWVNMGDSYANDGKWGGHTGGKHAYGLHGMPIGRNKRYSALKPKDLCMMPARLALALQADGWWLRAEIVWHKPNSMPESVTDRPTRSHEMIYLLAKSERYYYDADAIKDEVTGGAHPRGSGVHPKSASPGRGIKANSSWESTCRELVPSRNKRSVWTVTTAPFAEAHFATFPPKLIEPCVLAGTRPGDVVLDPFMGAGTVGVVARRHSRHYLGIELNPAYIAMAERRIAAEVQPVMWTSLGVAV